MVTVVEWSGDKQAKAMMIDGGDAIVFRSSALLPCCALCFRLSFSWFFASSAAPRFRVVDGAGARGRFTTSKDDGHAE